MRPQPPLMKLVCRSFGTSQQRNIVHRLLEALERLMVEGHEGNFYSPWQTFTKQMPIFSFYHSEATAIISFKFHRMAITARTLTAPVCPHINSQKSALAVQLAELTPYQPLNLRRDLALSPPPVLHHPLNPVAQYLPRIARHQTQVAPHVASGRCGFSRRLISLWLNLRLRSCGILRHGLSPC